MLLQIQRCNIGNENKNEVSSDSYKKLWELRVNI